MIQRIKIGGKAYSSNDVEIFMLGRVVQGVTEINYSSKDDVSNLFVVGSKKRVDVIDGSENHEGDITLLMDELTGLEISAGGNIRDIGFFDITIVFTKGVLITQQVLKNCKAISRDLAVKAGSTDALAYKIGLNIGEIPALKTV